MRAHKWARRVVAVLATAGFLGVGVAATLMVLPDSDSGEESLLDSAPAATPTAAPARKAHKPSKPKGPTKAQKAQLKSALAQLRTQGYTTTRQADYDFKDTLRVLIGRPVGDAGGGSYAFFFLRDRFLGRDALSPSGKLHVARSSKTTLTLSYGTYVAGDSLCCPSGRAKVRFRLEGDRVHALDFIPDAGARFIRRAA